MGSTAAAKELEGPACPEALLYLWEIFAGFPRESATRPAITWGELAAWQAVEGVQLTPFEAGCLFDLDRAAMNVLAEAPKPT